MEKTYIRNRDTESFKETIKEVYDVREGVVMDSLYGLTKSGTEFVALDTYETCYTSGLTVYTGTPAEIGELWGRYASAYDREFGEE